MKCCLVILLNNREPKSNGNALQPQDESMYVQVCRVLNGQNGRLEGRKAWRRLRKVGKVGNLNLAPKGAEPWVSPPTGLREREPTTQEVISRILSTRSARRLYTRGDRNKHNNGDGYGRASFTFASMQRSVKHIVLQTT